MPDCLYYNSRFSGRVLGTKDFTFLKGKMNQRPAKTVMPGVAERPLTCGDRGDSAYA